MCCVSVEPEPPARAGLQFRLLGPLEVSRGGVVLDLGPPKQRAILAALLLAEGRVVSSDRLIEAVWGDDPPPRAVSNIQVYISKIKSLLQDNAFPATRLTRRSPGYALTTQWVDVAEFRRLTAQAAGSIQRRSWSVAVAAAAGAVALWRGPFLDDLADEPWVSAEATHLDELYAQGMEAWVTGLLGQGNVGAAVTRSQTMVESYPLREHGWWLRMVALHRSGRSPEALAAYQHFTAELDEQLGLEPGPELRNLQMAVLRHDEEVGSWPNRIGEQVPGRTSDTHRPAESERPEPATTAVAPSRSEAPAPAPTSAGLAAIVGREPQLAVLDLVLDEVVNGQYRWVLLTGRAGIGKTRLATESVTRAQQRGVRTVWTSCPDDRGTPAWWPLRRLVTELGRAPDEVFLPPAGVDADTVRFVVYERFSQLLDETSTRTPLLVVIDDAQWLDAASLRCLAYLVRTQRLARVGIILTVRDRERRPEFDEVLATIGRQDFAVHPGDRTARRAQRFQAAPTGRRRQYLGRRCFRSDASNRWQPAPVDRIRPAAARRTAGRPYSHWLPGVCWNCACDDCRRTCWRSCALPRSSVKPSRWTCWPR